MEHFMVESKSFVTITIIVVIEVDLEVGSQAMNLVACNLDYPLAHNGCLESLLLAQVQALQLEVLEVGLVCQFSWNFSLRPKFS